MFIFEDYTSVSMILTIVAAVLTACVIGVCIYIGKNKKIREKIDYKRAKREEERAMQKRNK